METAKYKRVMLKLSGEALASDKGYGIDFETANTIACLLYTSRRRYIQ